jgi:hypothetical protein
LLSTVISWAIVLFLPLLWCFLLGLHSAAKKLN